jgi:hypothetical protein
MANVEPTDEARARVQEIKEEISALMNEHLSVVNGTSIINTGWFLVVRGASISDNVTHTSVLTNENQDFVSMLGFSRFAELPTERKFYMGL